MNKYSALSVLLITLLVPVLAHAQGITPYLETFSLFLRNVVMPFLFAIAFLVFLINITRYFIIEGASEEGRDKAKRNAFWGILAFVFLFSLWTIISLFLGGLNITQNEAYCPDYLTQFGFSGVCNQNSGATTGSDAYLYQPVQSTPSGSYSNSTGGTNVGTTPNTGSVTPSTIKAPLAELIFGTAADGASLLLVDSAIPLATASTPSINAGADCYSAVSLLQQAAKREATQAGYMYADGKWSNVTQQHTERSIAYSKNAVYDFMADHATKTIHVFHIHPDSRPDGLGLVMDGHGPSGADLEMLCSPSDKNITHHVVDESGVWSYKAGADTCPFDQAKRSTAAVVETYLALSTLEPTTRTAELQKYILSDLTSSLYDTHFTPLLSQDIDTMTDTQVRDLAKSRLKNLDISLDYTTDINSFCSSI